MFSIKHFLSLSYKTPPLRYFFVSWMLIHIPVTSGSNPSYAIEFSADGKSSFIAGVAVAKAEEVNWSHPFAKKELRSLRHSITSSFFGSERHDTSFDSSAIYTNTPPSFLKKETFNENLLGFLDHLRSCNDVSGIELEEEFIYCERCFPSRPTKQKTNQRRKDKKQECEAGVVEVYANVRLKDTNGSISLKRLINGAYSCEPDTIHNIIPDFSNLAYADFFRLGDTAFSLSYGTYCKMQAGSSVELSGNYYQISSLHDLDETSTLPYKVSLLQDPQHHFLVLSPFCYNHTPSFRALQGSSGVYQQYAQRYLLPLEWNQSQAAHNISSLFKMKASPSNQLTLYQWCSTQSDSHEFNKKEQPESFCRFDFESKATQNVLSIWFHPKSQFPSAWRFSECRAPYRAVTYLQITPPAIPERRGIMQQSVTPPPPEISDSYVSGLNPLYSMIPTPTSGVAASGEQVIYDTIPIPSMTTATVTVTTPL